MTKKVFVNVATLGLLMLGTLVSGYAQSSSPACNNNLIAGNYGFNLQGTKLGGTGPIGQQVGVAMTQFDGKGSFTQIDTVTVAGARTTRSVRSPDFTIGVVQICCGN
jgi:hypothetical protein